MRGKIITSKEASIKLQKLKIDFSTEAMKARRELSDTHKTQKENNCQPRIIYPVIAVFKDKGKIKTFSVKIV